MSAKKAPCFYTVQEDMEYREPGPEAGGGKGRRASGRRSAAGRIGGNGRGSPAVRSSMESQGRRRTASAQVGNDALAGLDPADGHLAKLEPWAAFYCQLLLGEAVGGTPLAYALAADVALLSVGV